MSGTAFEDADNYSKYYWTKGEKFIFSDAKGDEKDEEPESDPQDPGDGPEVEDLAPAENSSAF